MRLLGSLLILALLALPGRATHAQDATLHETLQLRYAVIHAAMAARDAGALGSLLAPDFRGEELSGKVQSRADMLAELAALPPRAAGDQGKTTLISVTPHGETIEVVQRYRNTSQKGEPPRNVELVMQSTDTWTHVGDTWLLSRTRSDTLDYFVDGKQVLHKVRGGK